VRHATRRALLLAAIAVAGPFGLVVDVLARELLLRQVDPEVAEVLVAAATRAAWWAVPAPVVGGLVAWWLYPVLRRRAHARLLEASRQRGVPSDRGAPTEAERADLEAMFLATSAVQVPAFAGDLAVMFGGPLAVGLVTASLASAAIVVVGVGRAPRRELSPSGAME
jgi:hypothetical protein